MNTEICNKPCASEGLTSYRYPSFYSGWIMIAAIDNTSAISEANRSLSVPNAELSKLEIWSEADSSYIPVASGEPEPVPVTNSCTFVVDVKEFRAALEFAVAEKKAPIPVLSTVCLSPKGSVLRILSTNLDLWSITEVPAIITGGDGSVLLPHRKTLDLLKGETGILRITAEIETSGDKFLHSRANLEVGGCEYELPGMDASRFPACPISPKPSFTIPGEDLKSTLGRIMPAVSPEESRYTLNGALLECSKGKLVFAATDGHRLALDSIRIDGDQHGRAVIQRDALAWMYKHSTGDVGISFGEEWSFVYLGNSRTTFVARNLTGKFPNYEAVTPREDSFTLTANFPSGDGLAKTLSKVARMADERSGCVRFSINGACILSAQSTDVGKASATVEASIKHSEDIDEIALGFNSSYVMDVLKVAGKNSVVLSLKDSQSAGVFSVPSMPEFSYILMPMRM
jgi:DNA polymerase-3 subunit beta